MAVTTVRPGFWLQHASNEAQQLVTFADELALTTAGRPGISFGPVNVPSTLNRLFAQARANGDAILEPHGHLLDREHTKRAAKHFPWLAQATRPFDRPTWAQWMTESVAHQKSAELRGTGSGPSFLVTPSPLLEAAHGTDELYAVLDAAVQVAAAQTAGTDVWLGVVVDRAYLREEPHLTRLADAILATNATGIVFRAFQSQLPPVSDAAYLSGLREVVQACSANNIRVFLPGSGWLGWLAMAWGAWGFSGGMAAGSWVDRAPSPMNPPKLPSLPYFEHQLLRALPWRVHDELISESDYIPCVCPDCQAMAGAHDSMLAKRHQIRHANPSGAELAALELADRRVVVAERLEAAIDFRDGLSTVNRGRAAAGFLDRWRNLV